MAYIGAGITRFNTADDLTVTDDAEIQGGLTVDSTTLVVDDVNNRVGIGTTSPGQKFHISDTAQTGTVRLRLENSEGASDIAVDANDLQFRVNTSGGSGSEAVRIDSSGNLKFNSGYGSVATAYGCRAWVRFDGTGTLSVSDSGGVSSVSDNGTGNYQINFSTTMPDSNYSTVCNAARIGSTSSQTFTIASTGTRGTNSQTINGRVIDNDAPSMAIADISEVAVAIFR